MKQLIKTLTGVYLLTQSLVGQVYAQNDTRFYTSSYVTARQNFRDLSDSMKQSESNTRTSAHFVPSRVDQDLTIDTLFIPAQSDTHKLVIISSGVHGAEAPAGSAIQRALLSQFVSGAKRNPNLSYLFVHAINPYGFKYGRRVSENNVDLNRNFDVNRDLFRDQNLPYADLYPVLNPNNAPSGSWWNHSHLVARLAKLRLSKSSGEISQAIGGGQYQFPAGIMFGGNDFEPQKQILEDILTRESAPFSQVLVLDLHTGYGRKAALQLLPNPADSKQIESRWAKVFGRYPIESVGSNNFYANKGDFATYVSRLLESKGKKTVPMLIEFGTLDSHTTKGSIATLSRLILENQWFHHQNVDTSTRDHIRSNFWQMFFPSDLSWRRKVMSDSLTYLPWFINNFAAMQES